MQKTLEDIMKILPQADQVRFVFRKTTSIPDSGLSRVVAGPFGTKEKLLTALTRIKQEKGLTDSFITSQ